MGGIGIWSMHFIGNRAIIMAEGRPDMQIVYNAGFTSVSFFLPIVVLSGAFYLLGATDQINRYYIAFAGVLMAVAVGSMHYVGQLGISNYNCAYRPGHVVGASIISLFASIAALNVFFRLRETWTDSWWKRELCGLVLACSVSGMHWTATVGTSYRFKGFGSRPTDPLSGKQTVIVCTTLVRSDFLPSGIGSDVQSVCCDLSFDALGHFDCRLQEEEVPRSSSTASTCLRILRRGWSYHGYYGGCLTYTENSEPLRGQGALT
jgi:NO-binding membrane sensor protein with MHYT domain